MGRRRAARALAACLVLACCAGITSAAAQRPLRLPPEFVIDRWTTRDGLPQNSVNAIARAADGALWIGTFGGLVRFDGASFRLQERVDSAGRHVDRVLSLAAEADGTLWVGTESGLLRFRDQRFEVVTDVPVRDASISALFIDRAGVLWVGMPGALTRRDGNGFAPPVSAVQGVTLGPVSAIEQDAGGTVWVTAGDRMLLLDPGTRAARWETSPVPGAAGMLLEDRAGTRWYALNDGLAMVSARGARFFRREHGVSRPADVVEDPRSGFWLTTLNDGLFYFDPAAAAPAATPYPLPDGRRNYRVRAVLVDDEGGTWFGTDAHGLLRARRNLFTTFTAEHGLSNDVSTAILVDAGGTVWAATNCYGVNALDLRARTVRTFKPRRQADPAGDPCVFSAAEGPRGTMWFGTWGGGLSRVTGGRDERLGRMELRDSVVLALFTDRGGSLWAGTSTGGVARLENGRVRQVYTTADGLAHNSVRTIYQSRDGALWFGTLGGLTRLEDGRLTSYRAASGLSSEHVRAVYEDAEGRLWVGTYGGGLNLFHEGAFVPITQRDGLADDVVSSIQEDAQGRLWMSGNRGISRVSRADLVALVEGRLGRVHAVLYGEEDGLRNAETNGGFQPAAARDAQGRFWYPTVRGVTMVDPAQARATTRAPAVTVDEVIVDGEPRPVAGGLVTGPGRPNLEFRYSGLSLSAPRHLSFRYRLDGFDDEWVEAGGRRVAYYPRLAPGKYRFEVRAANRDGAWSEAGAAVTLRVLAPVWDRWWFRAALLASLLVLAAVLARRRVAEARVRRAARAEFSRQLIASQEQERKRIAGELHDGLGQELLVVKNRALLALAAPGVPDAVRGQLEQISEITSQSLDNVRGLAHNLSPYQLDHLGLTTALRTMVEQAAAAADMRLQASIDDVDHLQPVDRQINLYRIVQEALSNVVRHSGAATADVAIRSLNGAIIVTVRDDGRGFAGANGAGSAGFGLSGMAERARILGGRLAVTSAPGQGTRLELMVPTVVPRARAEP